MCLIVIRVLLTGALQMFNSAIGISALQRLQARIPFCRHCRLLLSMMECLSLTANVMGRAMREMAVHIFRTRQLPRCQEPYKTYISKSVYPAIANRRFVVVHFVPMLPGIN